MSLEYKCAFIGCHGVGKTTLVNMLKDEFIVYEEAPLNIYTGKDAFLSELKMYTDYVDMNKMISKEDDSVISDRFGYLSVLIYVEGFKELGWISPDQVDLIYNIINNYNVEWVYPNKYIWVNESVDIVERQIKKRNREGLKEENKKYLKTIHNLYTKFSKKELKFKGLEKVLVDKIYSIPLVEISNNINVDEIKKIIN